jgi:isoleucyl-tRNA synthetase
VRTPSWAGAGRAVKTIPERLVPLLAPGLVHAERSPPYRALLTHGFSVDGQGKKMSKSKGNVVAPQKVWSTLGAEILRLWTGATDYSGDLAISEEILKRVVESYRGSAIRSASCWPIRRI